MAWRPSFFSSTTQESLSQSTRIQTRVFLDTYLLWHSLDTCLKNESLNPEGRCDLSFGSKVRLENLKAETMNGKEGVILSYTTEVDRFTVDIDGNPYKIKSCNIVPLEVHQDGMGQEVTSDLDFKSKFLKPGMLFEGTICIPGDAGVAGMEPGQMHRYVLNVVKVDEDWGNSNESRLLGRHWAYDDEQFIHISCENNEEGSFVIRYEDEETSCLGEWDDTKGELHGTVKQFVSQEDNILVPSDENIHYFVLKPVNPQLAKYREKTHEALRSCLACYLSLIEEGNALDELFRSDEFRADMCEVRWFDLLIAAQLQAEEVCARFRRGAKLLNNMEFETPLHRKEALERLSLPPAKLSLVRAHEMWDKHMRLMQAVARGFLLGGSPTQTQLNNAIGIAHIRLQKNYSVLDIAIKQAESRLTKQTLLSYATRPASMSASSDADDETCAICLMPLTEKEQSESPQTCTEDLMPLYLPCSHFFHGSCIRSWLLNHSQCPMCRAQLNEDP